MKRALLTSLVAFIPGLAFSSSFVELCQTSNPQNTHTREVLARQAQYQGDCVGLYAALSKITELDVSYEEITDISLIAALPQLQSLNISGVRAKLLAPLRNLQNLRELIVVSRNVSDLSVVSELHQLEKIFIDNTRLSNLDFLRPLKKLVYLHFDQATELKDIAALGEQLQLQELVLGGYKTKDVTVIKNLKNLKVLSLTSDNLTNLDFLQDLKQLEDIAIRGKQVDLSVLVNFGKLKSLHVEHSGVQDIAALKGLSELEEVYLGDNKITDISPLANLKKIKTLRISNNPYSDLSPIKDLHGISHLEAATKTIKAKKENCPYGAGINSELNRFCRRYLGVK